MPMASIEICHAADANALCAAWAVARQLRPEFDCKRKAFHLGTTLH